MHVAVDSLPDREREVIELAYFCGLAQSEIAERLSCPSEPSRHEPARALQRMAPMLREEVGCDERRRLSSSASSSMLQRTPAPEAVPAAAAMAPATRPSAAPRR